MLRVFGWKWWCLAWAWWKHGIIIWVVKLCEIGDNQKLCSFFQTSRMLWDLSVWRWLLQRLPPNGFRPKCGFFSWQKPLVGLNVNWDLKNNPVLLDYILPLDITIAGAKGLAVPTWWKACTLASCRSVIRSWSWSWSPVWLTSGLGVLGVPTSSWAWHNNRGRSIEMSRLATFSWPHRFDLGWGADVFVTEKTWKPSIDVQEGYFRCPGVHF